MTSIAHLAPVGEGTHGTAHQHRLAPARIARPLRIAQLSTPHEATPPRAYGSINRIVADLTNELVVRGHEVHLFATGDSQTLGELHSVYAQPDASFVNVGRDWFHSLHSLREIQHFDVLHNHNLFSGSALSFLANVRATVTTAHFYTHRDRDFLARVPRQHFAVQSRSQAFRMNWLPDVHLVEPGIDVASYPLAYGHAGYLLVLSQVGDHKGIREAIAVARACMKPLVIAGPIPPWHRDYYDAQIRPHLGNGIDYVGEVSGNTRLELIQGANGLLMFSKVPETFGLSCVEAMACGTPVIGSSRGALRELIRHGVNGFVADTHPERCAAVDGLSSIDPAVCRAYVEAAYTVTHMADRYLSLYARLLEAGSPQ